MLVAGCWKYQGVGRIAAALAGLVCRYSLKKDLQMALINICYVKIRKLLLPCGGGVLLYESTGDFAV